MSVLHRNTDGRMRNASHVYRAQPFGKKKSNLQLLLNNTVTCVLVLNNEAPKGSLGSTKQNIRKS